MITDNPTYPSSAGFITSTDGGRITVYQGCKLVLPYNACLTHDDFPGLYALNRDLPDEVEGPMFGKVVAIERDETGLVTRLDVKLWRQHDDLDDEAWLGLDLDDPDQLAALVDMAYLVEWDELQLNTSKTWTCELCGEEVHSDFVSLDRHKETGVGYHLHPDCGAWVAERLDNTRPISDREIGATFKGIVHEWRTANPSIGRFINRDGVPFNVVVVFSGSPYGRSHCLTNDGETTVEFYDARYMHTRHGQFVSRYTLSSLLGQSRWSQRQYGQGLILDGGLSAWTVDGETMNTIIDTLLAWLAEHASKGLRFQHVTDADLAVVRRLVEDRIELSEDGGDFEEVVHLERLGNHLPAPV